MNSQTANKKDPAQSGFTFAELIVVIVIISILVAFSVPIFKKTIDFSGTSDKVTRLMSQIQELKIRAIEDDVDYFLHLNEASQSVWVTRQDMDELAQSRARQNAVFYDDKMVIRGIEKMDNTGKRHQSEKIRFSRHGYSDRALIHLKESDRDTTLKVPVFLARVERIDRHESFDECY